jgi:hypothetical protein
MIERKCTPAGDPFVAAAKARKKATRDHELRTLEERYRHELLSDEERQELRDRIIRLQRGLGTEASEADEDEE